MLDRTIFDRFPTVPAVLEEGFKCDSFLGTRYRAAFDSLRQDAGIPNPPPVDDEIFEWIALLTAVQEAAGTFTFVEAGAGYGRWSIRAAAAARALGKRFRIACVEAEPTHYWWLTQTLLDNDVDPREHEVFQAALTNRSGTMLLLVDQHPDRFWGQTAEGPPAGLRARLRQLKRRAKGMRHIEVQTITLDELLAPLESVDLIDFDVQGSEFDAISASESLSKARLLHIGTHGREIEAELRRYLAVKGWHCEADYSCHSSASTPVGQVAFQDGVQVWRNLRK